MNELDNWRVFLAVAETGSFAGAARTLELSVPTTSKRIAALEQSLGTPLFHRTSRRISLTSAGEELLPEIRLHLRAIEGLSSQLKDRDGPLCGPIRLTAPISFSQVALRDPLVTFMKTWPDVRVDLRLSDRRIDVVEGSYDLAIRIGELSDSSQRVIKICDIARLMVASPAYLDARGEPQVPADLWNHDCIRMSHVPEPGRWPLEHPEQGRQIVDIASRFSVDNGDLARAAAIDGIGIVVLPEFFVQSDIEEGRLAEVLKPWSMAPIALNLVMPPSRLRARRTQALIDHLTRTLAKKPWRSGKSDSAG